MINKSKNVNLQLTISKNSYEKLLNIQSDLNELLNFELSKSQTIEYLIKQYETKAPIKADAKAKQSEKELYKSRIIALKDALNVSYPRLSQIIGIPEPTIKKYAMGKQAPTGENKQLLDNALKHYGIKI